ncbi:MAG TPA: glucose 1-dehydrogenase [Myxococcota bacterium]|nr:glucose 1-dehydrogenase [Myxococcota bacterium]HRY95797.1 glucose 1-dehydrogenase [Myxococcota bacterium]HSA21162.1 glucose 1-dehydrogenase [Myxococcota bacterium]
MVMTGGRVILVSGASRGIGAAVARRFARAGARLVLNHRADEGAMRQVAEGCRADGAACEVVRGDVADPATAGLLVARALEAYGRLDTLVNNAGVAAENLLLSQPDEEIRRVVETNVLGQVWLARAALEPMLKARAGCIVNLSSTLARKPSRGGAVYAGTKGFAEAFTRALAVEVGRKGIRVNAVAPGIVETGMTAPLRALAGEELRARVPLRRFASADEIAALVCWLASDEAAYVHGAVLDADGGFAGGM